MGSEMCIRDSQGVIREQGDPAEFFANPQSAEAQDFLARFRGAE